MNPISDPIAAGETKTARHARRLRLRLAMAATAGSIASGVVADRATGSVRTVAGVAVALLIGVGLWAIYAGAPVRLSQSRLTPQYVALVVAALVVGAVLLRAGGSSVGEWRYTAVAIAVTVPNWYAAAASVGRPRAV